MSLVTALMRRVLIFALIGVVAGVGVCVHAQGIERATLASPLMIEGEVRDGDLISYDLTSSTYRTSRIADDPNLFGVVVDDPILYLDATTTSVGVRPVARFGEATVSVSTLHGEIKQGDLVTSSRIPGVGARADREEALYILGFATETMTFDMGVAPMVVDGTEVRFGWVSVALRIGANAREDSDDDSAMTSTSTGVGMGDETAEAVEENTPIDPFKVFRYILGTVVAITAVVLALRRFGDLFAQSVISVGRNPLARGQIRSILVWNAVLIIVVSGVGLGLGVAIIMVP